MKKLDALSHLTVMFVENDSKFQNSLGQYLKTLFKKLHIYTHTLDALKEVKKIKPDIIITNIKHQRLSGLDLIKAIKQNNSTAEAIVTSSSCDKDSLIAAMRMDVVDFLEKPYKEHEMEAALLKANTKILQRKEYIELKRKSMEEHIENSDSSKLFELFESLRRDEIPIDIINFYKGLPLINTGYIKEVKNDNIYIQTQSLQKLVMNLEKNISVESSILPRPIKFEVNDITSFSNPVQLVNPVVKNFSLRRRKDVRLLPDDSFKLSLEVDGHIIPVRVDDVSSNMLTYAVINIEDKDLLDDGISIDTHLTFTLDKEGEITLDFKSEVKRIKRGSNIIFAIIPILEGQDAEDFNQYILQREFQIINELKNLRLINGI